MKLLENTIYSLIIFVFVYIVVSLSLRLFELTDVFASHMIGGILATVLAVGTFVVLLIYKEKK
jgi:hypothetical protein